VSSLYLHIIINSFAIDGVQRVNIFFMREFSHRHEFASSVKNEKTNDSWPTHRY